MNARSVFARSRCLCALTSLLLAGPAALPAQSGGGDGRRSSGDESGHVIRIIPGPSASRDTVILTSHSSATTPTTTADHTATQQPLLRLPSITPRYVPAATQSPAAETLSAAQQTEAEDSGAAAPFPSSPASPDAGPTAAQRPSRMMRHAPRRRERPSLLDRLFGRWLQPQPPANTQRPHSRRTAERELPPAPQHLNGEPQDAPGEPKAAPGLLPEFVRFPDILDDDEPKPDRTTLPSERPLRKNVPPPPDPSLVRQANPAAPLPGGATAESTVMDFDNPFRNVPVPEAAQEDAPATAAPVELAAPQQPEFRSLPLETTSEPAVDEFIPPVIGGAADQQPGGEVRDKLELIAERSGLSGLKGFCPVELRDQRNLVDADPTITAAFEGATYTFSSDEAKEKFLATPEKYAPVDGGSDIILTGHTGARHAGSLDHAIWYQGRLHLFSSRDSLETFLQTIESENAVQ